MIGQYGPIIPFGPAGPMQNLLGPLAGHCPNLKTLTLRKVGQRRHAEFTPEFCAKDEDIYREFAIFISSVKQTLRRVVFEQGERATRPSIPAAGPIFPVAPPPIPAAGHVVALGLPRPMDTLFHQILYPQLFRGDWRLLESMTIGGVHASWTSGSLTIRTSDRSDVSAVTRRDVEVMDHIGLGDPLAGVR